mgnify:CR=1 FL=1
MMITEEQIYMALCLTSVVVCMTDAVLLLRMRGFLREMDRKLYRPERYISARYALGVAFLIMAVMTAGLLFRGLAAPSEKFFSIGNLVISSSQALLFTIATLALLNSRLVRRNVILWNCLPIALFVVVHFIFIEHDEIGRGICYCFFTFYVVQLIIYTVVFAFERKEYIHKLKVNCTAEEFGKCRNNGVTWIFVSALLVGILALASYFFTQYWQLSLFVLTYTVFYTAVTVYFLKYAGKSAEIESITADDRDF